MFPVVGKLYCSSSQTKLMVRKRPYVVNGGGFTVLNGRQEVVFIVEGCGSLGAEGELILKDGDRTPVLFIKEKGGLVQAMSFHNLWNGYLMDFNQPTKLIFTLREPKQCLVTKSAIKVSLEPNKHWDFEVKGSFIEKSCTINDRKGDIIAEVRVNEPINDVYQVVVQPGYDQAFVIGIIAVLDNINGETTRC